MWRESPASAAGAVTLFPVGLATIAFGLGSAAADQAGLIVLAGAVLLAPLAAAQGRAGAAALAVLALLPPFALFGAALAVLAEAVDAAPWLVVPLAGLMAAGAAGLARAAVAAWPQQRGWSADDSAAALVLALALAAGTVPAVAGWFAAVARGIR